MTNINPLNEMTFMNTIPLLRNAFVALSLGAFLTSNAFAAQANDDEHAGAPAASSALVPYTAITQDGGGGAGGAVDTPFIKITEEDGTSTWTSLLPIGHSDALIDAKRLGDHENPRGSSINLLIPEELIQHLCEDYLSVRDGVALRSTCYAFYHALLDTRFDRAFSFGKLLHHMNPADRAPEFPNSITDLPLVLPGDFPSIFRNGLIRLNNHTHALPAGLLAGADNLRFLYLNDYHHDLPARFLAGMTDLRYLYLINHPHPFPEGFLDGLTNLQGLNLNGHPHPLPEGLLAGAANLESLYLEDHQHALPAGFLDGMPDLNELCLRGHTQPLPEGFLDGLRARGVTVYL